MPEVLLLIVRGIATAASDLPNSHSMVLVHNLWQLYLIDDLGRRMVAVKVGTAALVILLLCLRHLEAVHGLLGEQVLFLIFQLYSLID